MTAVMRSGREGLRLQFWLCSLCWLALARRFTETTEYRLEANATLRASVA